VNQQNEVTERRSLAVIPGVLITTFFLSFTTHAKNGGRRRVHPEGSNFGRYLGSPKIPEVCVRGFRIR